MMAVVISINLVKISKLLWVLCPSIHRFPLDWTRWRTRRRTNALLLQLAIPAIATRNERVVGFFLFFFSKRNVYIKIECMSTNVYMSL